MGEMKEGNLDRVCTLESMSTRETDLLFDYFCGLFMLEDAISNMVSHLEVYLATFIVLCFNICVSLFLRQNNLE